MHGSSFGFGSSHFSIKHESCGLSAEKYYTIYKTAEHSGQIEPEKENMRRHYKVCTKCNQSCIWEDRLMTRPNLTCNLCGAQWQKD